MQEVLEGLRDELNSLHDALSDTVANDLPFSNSAGWTSPAVSRSDLQDEIQDVLDLIGLEDSKSEIPNVEALADFQDRIKFLTNSTIPNLPGNPAAAIPVILITLNALRRELVNGLKLDPRREIAADLRAVRDRLRSADAEMNSLAPKLELLSSMVTRIENAYNAADQLPADLQSLSEARLRIDSLAQDATKSQGRAHAAEARATEISGKLAGILENANSTMARCESAYSAATSVGLAAAFQERSTNLSKTMGFWVGGLVTALIAGVGLGVWRVLSLGDLVNGQASDAKIALNAVVTVLSVGGPIWFAWLATKQIGQRFRLSEDYAFKASISRAYEGYRREAARIDPDLEARLLASALDRLDELPLRLVELASHGSPIQEAMSSELVREAFKVVPDFADKLKGFSAAAIGSFAAAASAGSSPGKSRPADDPEEPEEGK